MTTGGEDIELKVQAWKLVTQENLPQREVSRRLGVAQSTVSRYVQEGREAEAYFVALAKREMRQDMAYQLWGLVRRWLGRLEAAEALEMDMKTELAISEHIAKLWAQLALLLGLNEPARLAVGKDDGEPRTPDPRFVAEIERAARSSEHYLDRIRAGLPGRTDEEETA